MKLTSNDRDCRIKENEVDFVSFIKKKSKIYKLDTAMN